MNADLRRRAEQRLAATPAADSAAVADLQRLAHELQVHQLELELQNEELRRMKEAAEAASRAKSEFLANLSHEIRTPLHVILSLGQSLKHSASPEQADRIARLNLAGNHLLTIIDDILDLTKVEAGRLALVEKEFDPGTLLTQVRDLVAEAAVAKGLALDVEGDGLPPRLAGDPARLRQALLNYAGNAVKFTERGGVILRAMVLKEDADEVWLRFEVRDTGGGIDAATQARLFLPFEQGDGSATRRHGGTGLGLALVRRLAGLMGGDAGVESTPGVGSLFWFTARLGQAAKVGADGTAAATDDAATTDAARILKHEFSGRRVLLADDDRLGRYGSALLLRELGLDVEVSDDGEQALARFTTVPPDLVLMDVRMPVMDGLEATRRIRALPNGRDVPIVAVTANAFEQDRTACLAAGMDDFVAKPFVLEDLAQMVLHHLRRTTTHRPGSQ